MISIDGSEISLVGDLDTRSVTRAFKDMPQFTEPLYQVNLDQIGKIDSAGLALLVYWHNKATASSSRLVFSRIPHKLTVMAELGGFRAIFQ